MLLVYELVTTRAERNQVVFRISAGVTAELFVVDLQVLHGPQD